MSDVPEGYKMSEVGVIPEEWEVMTLENITTEIGDGIHSTPQYVPYSDIFFVNGNNLVNNSIKITDNTMCVSEYEYNKYKKRLNDRTILLSINGTIGNIAFFNDEKVILGKSAAYINVNNSTNKIFIFYLMQSPSIKNYFEDELTGSTIRNLSLKTIINTPIALPPTIEEQEAIASALSDVDALIAALEQLITKKRNIKQGAMQQLLTGEKRLPGFGGVWKVKTLGEITKIFVGKDLKEENFSSYADNIFKYPVYSNTVDNEGLYGYYNIAEYQGDSLSVVGRGVGLGTAFNRNGGYGAIGRLLLLFPDINVDTKYLCEYINQRVKIFKESSGIPQLTGISLAKYEIPLPPTIEEQTAIAQILSDMDTEIEALKQKQDKYKAIKQGMMQELLTGKTRLAKEDKT